MNAKDIRQSLKNRFCAPNWLLAEELELVPGSRADAVALNIGGETKLARSFLGFEIKVSRSDFLHELKNPAKRAAAYMGCDAIFICCPSKMVDVRELPDDLGLLEVLNGGGNRIKRYPVGWESPISKVTRLETHSNPLFTGVYPTVHLDELPPIPRTVAAAFARSFNPDRADMKAFFRCEAQRRTIEELQYKLKDAKREVVRDLSHHLFKNGASFSSHRIVSDSFCV